jgi:hypothetical protein
MYTCTPTNLNMLALLAMSETFAATGSTLSEVYRRSRIQHGAMQGRAALIPRHCSSRPYSAAHGS